jgi:hypothetical protein
MSFNPVTDYAGDWQWQDDVRDATHRIATAYGGEESHPTDNACKVKRQNHHTGDYREIARAFGMTGTDAMFTVWDHQFAGIDPKANDQLILIDLPDGVNPVDETWIVKGIERVRFGSCWLAGCRKAVTNA